MRTPRPLNVLQANPLIMVRAADLHGRRAARRMAVGREDLEEIRQDILVVVVSAAPSYDGRSSPRTFADRVARNAAYNIWKARSAEKRTATLVEHDEALGDPEALHRDRLAQRNLDLARDVHRARAHLSEADRALCDALVRHDGEVAGAARELKLSRAAFYRRRDRVREALTDAGLDTYVRGAA
ncbi:MAG: sigma-70 family RNA polymerase sigma factor [Polyangiaceae bacterium]|nr:sigma-70 family RNA polymerase sigma factor [Polyangiaceae bacterium]